MQDRPLLSHTVGPPVPSGDRENLKKLSVQGILSRELFWLQPLPRAPRTPGDLLGTAPPRGHSNPNTTILLLQHRLLRGRRPRVRSLCHVPAPERCPIREGGPPVASTAGDIAHLVDLNLKRGSITNTARRMEDWGDSAIEKALASQAEEPAFVPV